MLDTLLSLLPTRYLLGAVLLLWLCSVIAPFLPQPPAGSRWVIPRRVLDALANNYLSARNAVQAGSPQATVTPFDVLESVMRTHEEARPERARIAAAVSAMQPAVEAIPGKIADVQRRVTMVLARDNNPAHPQPETDS